MADTDTLKVSFKVKNTGSVAGAEIAQVYVSDKVSTIYKPVKELKGFKKVWLERVRRRKSPSSFAGVRLHSIMLK